MAPTSWGEFVVLPENTSAVRATRRLARSLVEPTFRTPPSPLVLHGPPGTGKSLLLQTLVRKLADHPTGPTVQVLPAGDLPRPAPDDPEAADLFADLTGCDLLAVEDVQHLPGRSASALGRVLDARAARRRPTVVTASAGPAGLTALPRRLTSRLAAGLVVQLEPITAAGRRELVGRLAARRRLNLSDDALDYLAGPATGGGVRPLVGAVEKLKTLTRGVLGSLDAEAVAELLAGDGVSGDPVDRIINRVAAAFGVKPADLLGACRQRTVLVPRQVAMYLAREVGKRSLPQIAKRFGRDHTTVMHACRKVAEAMKTDPKLRRTVRELRAELS
ncbi:MAG: helix-turn-helix domain-containing protein [Gemmataceae bacterium]